LATKYRCYLMQDDRIAAVQVIEGDDDEGALLEADRILASSHYAAAEVWDRSRKVWILNR
jgi:hypothetical protein